MTTIDDTRAAPVAPPRGRGGAPTGSAPERFATWAAADFAEPTARDEEWKFAPLRRLRPLLGGAPGARRLAPGATLPAGARLEDLPPADPLLRQGPAPQDRLGALAGELSPVAAALRVQPGAEPDEPIILRLTGAEGELAWGRLVLDIGARARAVVVLEHDGAGAYGALTSALIGEGAALTLVHVHSGDLAAVHNEHIGARLERDAAFTMSSASLGGGVVRLTPTVHLAGPGAAAELLGLSFAGAGQHHESRLYIDHAAPDCTSDVHYKSALQGEGARVAWVGDVRIRPAATGTRTYELNRNLLLSDGARADSVPNLEIETGEIHSAGHASATGRFDDLQLFYLRSRGIPEAEARRLVVRGFFAEILARIPVPELRERLMAAIDRRLDAA
ncbi:MAG: Fe-S cluster assembly protein SufD [Frankiaceae bacterium]|jgi:Fe-S cluster assembly protein SufD|nr:Fe-S cluster assembly protein SufD [Frankiaceae bacterium]